LMSNSRSSAYTVQVVAESAAFKHHLLAFHRDDIDLDEFEEPVSFLKDTQEEAPDDQSNPVSTVIDANAAESGVISGPLDEIDVSKLTDAQKATYERRKKQQAKRERTRQYLPTIQKKREIQNAREKKKRWLLQDAEQKRVFVASREEKESGYVLFVMENNKLNIVPVTDWFTLRPNVLKRDISVEETEAVMKSVRRGYHVDRFAHKATTTTNNKPNRAASNAAAASSASATRAPATTTSHTRAPASFLSKHNLEEIEQRNQHQWVNTPRTIYDNDNETDTLTESIFKVQSLKKGEGFDYNGGASDDEVLGDSGDDVSGLQGFAPDYSSDDELTTTGKQLKEILEKKLDPLGESKTNTNARRKRALSEMTGAPLANTKRTKVAKSARARQTTKKTTTKGAKTTTTTANNNTKVDEISAKSQIRKNLEQDVIRVLTKKHKMRAVKLMKRVLGKERINDPVYQPIFYKVVHRLTNLIDHADPKTKKVTKVLVLKRKYAGH